jgi:hypothetical protein
MSMELTTYEASEESGLSTSHLRRLLAKNAIKGRLAKITTKSGIWLIDNKSLLKYIGSQRKPGPKRKK